MALEAYPEAEADVAAWAADYVRQQKQRMAATAATGVRPDKPSRAEVERAVQARFGNGSGRQGILGWIRIAFWVLWILSQL